MSILDSTNYCLYCRKPEPELNDEVRICNWCQAETTEYQTWIKDNTIEFETPIGTLGMDIKLSEYIPQHILNNIQIGHFVLNTGKSVIKMIHSWSESPYSYDLGKTVATMKFAVLVPQENYGEFNVLLRELLHSQTKVKVDILGDGMPDHEFFTITDLSVYYKNGMAALDYIIEGIVE